jgi:hypothetical protein
MERRALLPLAARRSFPHLTHPYPPKGVPAVFEPTHSVPGLAAVLEGVPAVFEPTRSVPGLAAVLEGVPAVFEPTRSVPGLAAVLEGIPAVFEPVRCYGFHHIRSPAFIMPCDGELPLARCSSTHAAAR